MAFALTSICMNLFSKWAQVLRWDFPESSQLRLSLAFPCLNTLPLPFFCFFVFWVSFVECFSLKILVLYSFEVLLQFWGGLLISQLLLSVILIDDVFGYYFDDKIAENKKLLQNCRSKYSKVLSNGNQFMLLICK